MTSMMVRDRAQRWVKDFQQRCGAYGEAALHLAYHAALPVALNAELLHLLRINFFLDPPEVLPYTVEFEFLLSPLCREIDEGLYEVEPEIRDVLLTGLAQTYGVERTRDVATLLWQYVERQSAWDDRVELERAQQLTALHFLNPEKAQQWLVAVETEVSQGQVAAREWFVAMRKDIENQAQRLKDINSDEIQGAGELPAKDFFISYNRHDQQWAEWIAWVLEEAGYTAIIQAWDFRPGGNFVLDMQRAVAECQKTIAVLSENYLRSAYTQPEWAAAFAQNPTSTERKLIPVRVENCQLNGLLAQIVYLDVFDCEETEAQQQLLDAVREGRVKPSQKPTFPGRIGERVALEHVEFPGLQSKPLLNTSSTPSIYRRLEELLLAGNWEEANQETWSIMGNVSREEDIEKLPCEWLQSIDQLWLKHSNARFGFSVQWRVLEETFQNSQVTYKTCHSEYSPAASIEEYNDRLTNRWQLFGKRLGWYQDHNWVMELDYTGNIADKPKGYLPCLGTPRQSTGLYVTKKYGLLPWCWLFLSRIEECGFS
ncbi:MAG: TIR domain-containing protein [Scytolyngbya sp. HA4215-MV1]|nr:TIR domain-containing protein [Scytolyngbya sp. HA4215-MV1]